MKHVTKKLSLLILFVLCFSTVLMIACTAQSAQAPESEQNSVQNDKTQSNDAQAENSAEEQSDDTSKDSSESTDGIFSGLDPMNKENIVKSLQIFGKGMVAIFAVIIIIVIVVKLVQKVIAALTAPPKDE